MKPSTVAILLILSFAAGSYYQAVWRHYLFPPEPAIAAN
jgi:hypothetical protein